MLVARVKHAHLESTTRIVYYKNKKQTQISKMVGFIGTDHTMAIAGWVGYPDKAQSRTSLLFLNPAHTDPSFLLAPTGSA